MAKTPLKKTTTKKTSKKIPSVKKASPIAASTSKREKNSFERNFGEGTAFDLDYGKLLIIALCIYIALKVS